MLFLMHYPKQEPREHSNMHITFWFFKHESWLKNEASDPRPLPNALPYALHNTKWPRAILHAHMILIFQAHTLTHKRGLFRTLLLMHYPNQEGREQSFMHITFWIFKHTESMEWPRVRNGQEYGIKKVRMMTFSQNPTSYILTQPKSKHGREHATWTFRVVWEFKIPLLTSKPYLSHAPKPKNRHGQEQV